MSISAPNAAAFYREVADSGNVWGIKDADGFPAPKNRDGARAMPFWSSESRANSFIVNVPGYENFKPVSVPWTVFCERWVPGLVADGLLAGVNWSGARGQGYDIEPADVQRNVEAMLGRPPRSA